MRYHKFCGIACIPVSCAVGNGLRAGYSLIINTLKKGPEAEKNNKNRTPVPYFWMRYHSHIGNGRDKVG